MPVFFLSLLTNYPFVVLVRFSLNLSQCPPADDFLLVIIDKLYHAIVQFHAPLYPTHAALHIPLLFVSAPAIYVELLSFHLTSVLRGKHQNAASEVQLYTIKWKIGVRDFLPYKDRLVRVFLHR